MSPKRAVERAAIALMRRAGLYRPFTEEESRKIRREPVEFVGDLPAAAGGEFNQYREEYALARTPFEVEDLVYTPRGMGWSGGRLLRRCSIREPVLRDVLESPFPRPADVLERATVIQTETPYTYGDWVGEQLMSLATAGAIAPPLLLPRHLMAKGYVRRDMHTLGVEAVAVERPVRVRRALVLPKTNCFHNFAAGDLQAYRAALKVEPVEPRPGSILYLSRQGESGELNQNRTYPSEMTAEILEELGARVVLAREASQDDYRALAGEAETVVADHGSALCNLAFWRTRTVVELFSERWWNGYFLFFAKASGVSTYALVRVDDVDRETLRRKILGHLGPAR